MSETKWLSTDALQVKAKFLRSQILRIAYRAKRGHLGGTFSVLDILVALYYGGFRFGVSPGIRDYIFFGKGHCSLAVYCILADIGFIQWKTLDENYGVDGGQFGAQLDVSTPCVDYNTGSLGNVVGVAAGQALAAKMDKKDSLFYAIIGDAECEEGSVWESLRFAADHRLNNLVVIIDRNKLSVTDVVEDKQLKLKLLGFDCWPFEVDGHDMEVLHDWFISLRKRISSNCMDTPCVIIANTIKGKGVSFMEGVAKWHHAALGEAEFQEAMKQLGE